ncbi:cation:proton antiporter family protein [Congregibacter brevis]|uniref:Cation:proton antiporter family protein n=1 Tax=Congregibacter brevis TaxID=3081201 RepID=A0ABZ0IBU3_9GAMM|nr:cation:proton antiporter family protein [Congregibacter sp. IMCC45268]
MELSWIGVALIFGIIAKKLGQAPLVGFLAAGFALSALGVDPGDALDDLANVGVLLLLFAIGLKIDLPSLLQPHIFAASLLHTAAMVLIGMAFLYIPVVLEIGPFAGLSWSALAILGLFAAFSSTLFVIKVLEERENMNALYGRVIIGFLVMQDLVAVALLAVSKGVVPSPWAFALLALIPLRHVLGRLLEWCGHRELLVLAGLSLTLGGAALFDLVGMKADLGALVAGALVSKAPKAKELSNVLLGLKDLLLVGFFLTIGLNGLPAIDGVVVAVGLLVLLPIKALLFVALLMMFGLRGRSALLASLGLTPYSEFGLIIAAMAVSKGYLDPSWIVTLAVAMGFSFLPLSIVNERALDLYRKLRERLTKLERGKLILPERTVPISDATALVFGMGRVGSSAYEAVRAQLGDTVVAFDVDGDVVEQHQTEGRRVFEESATDADFWGRLNVDREQVRLVVLAMHSHEENLTATEQLRLEGFSGHVAATAYFEDEVSALRDAGVDFVFNVNKDVGPALAQRSMEQAGLTKLV